MGKCTVHVILEVFKLIPLDHFFQRDNNNLKTNGSNYNGDKKKRVAYIQIIFYLMTILNLNMTFYTQR